MKRTQGDQLGRTKSMTSPSVARHLVANFSPDEKDSDGINIYLRSMGRCYFGSVGPAIIKFTPDELET